MIKNTSYISPKSEIHSSVKIGPFCYIGDNVSIGRNCELKSHVSLTGHTNIGENNIFYPTTVESIHIANWYYFILVSTFKR